MSDHPVQITFEKAIEKARSDERARFIKQACEAIIENISNTFESDYIKGFDDGLRGAIQTIKEQIK